MKNRHFLVLATLCIIISILSCSSDKNNTTEISTTKYPIMTLSQRDTVLHIPYVADLQALKNIELRSRVEGILEKIHIQEGQMVKKGQVLFTINNADLQIELNKAQAKYNSAKAEADVANVEVERVQFLVDNEVVTLPELQLAKAKYKALLASVEVAKSEMEAVRKRISYSTITAPFTGMVDRIPLKEGSLITSESLLTTISDISTIKAYFHISENQYYQMRNSGDLSNDIFEIKLALPDGTIYSKNGILTNAESEIDASTGNIAFKVLFENPESLLRHETSGKILLTRAINDALLIPQKSVFEIQDKNFVFILQPDSTVNMRSIQVSERLADLYLLKEGLNNGEKIIVEGIQSLKEGEKIEPQYL